MNKEISELLYQIAELLSFSKENLFRVRAYENAARVIESYPRDIEELVKNNELKEIPGIGKSIEEKITEYLSTGRLKYLDELKKEIPEGLLDIMNIPGMGPRKTKIVYENLHIFAYYRGGVGVEMVKEGFNNAKIIIDMLSKLMTEKGKHESIVCEPKATYKKRKKISKQ